MDAVRTNVVVDVQEDGNTWIYQLDKSLEDEEAWVNRLKKRVEETEWRCHHCTIYKVPPGLRMVDPIAYEPKILSLGPYHHGKPHLRAMDELKWRYLKSFLCRNPERSLEDYLKLVVNMEERTRNAYSEAPQMDSKHWVEMMLLDSCFVIELHLLMEFGREESDDEEVDPIQSTSWVRPPVLGDMLLLENQLPFFLLEKLLELNSSSSSNSRSLAKLVLDMFVDLMPGKVRVSSLDNIGDIHHILHLLYFCTLPNNPATDGRRPRGLLRRLWSFCADPLLRKFNRKSRSSTSSSRNSSSSNSNSGIFISDEPSPLQWVASAKNLLNAGVSFRKKTKNVTSFMDITFRKGTLEIPPLQIFGQSNAIFRNLIAFEQCHMGNTSPTQLAAYAYLMDCIIDTPEDVDLLQQEGIIVSTLGNDDDVARFFNRLRTSAAIDEDSYLSGVFEDVQRHCDKRRNKWKATLNHNYFNNPWAIVSVIAAIFLFLLTIITFRGGTLEIPPLQIFGQSNSIFRNLIAFEQCHMGNTQPTQLTAYAYLMDCIIDTQVDVDLLQRNGIIVSTLGNDDEVAGFFNRLRINAAIDESSYLSGVFDDVKHHCNKKTNKWKALWNQNYFSNPRGWVIVSVIAAIFLFLLTIMQTVLAFFSYLRPRSP